MERIGSIRARVATAVFAASLACLGVAVAAPQKDDPDKIRFKTGSFVVTCTSTGQICNPPQKLKLKVTNGDGVRVKRLRYQAATTHCSPGRILISLDGERIGRTGFVQAGERAIVDDLKVTLDKGRHKFAFRMEGKLGGCNVGAVGSWGGKITLIGFLL